MKSLLFAFAIFLFQNSASAQTTFTGQISDIGCHHVNATCYATFRNVPIALPECANKGELRWDNADSEDGRRTYSSLLSAFLTDTWLSVTVSGCTIQGYPAILYYHLIK